MKKNVMKRILAIFLTVTLLMVSFPILNLGAYAEEAEPDYKFIDMQEDELTSFRLSYYEEYAVLRFVPEESGIYKFSVHYAGYSWNNVYIEIYDSDGSSLTKYSQSSDCTACQCSLEENKAYYFKISSSVKICLCYALISKTAVSNHNFVQYEQEADCINNGGIYKKCTVCGLSECLEYREAAKGHNCENGVCVDCGCPEGLVCYMSDGTVTVANFYGSCTDLHIPSEICGASVGVVYEIFSNSHASVNNLYIPDTVFSISLNQSDSYSDLENIIVDENNPYFSSDENGILYNKDKTILLKYPMGKSDEVLTVSQNVKTIETYALAFSRRLRKVIINDNVEMIKECAFYNCNAIEEMYIFSDIKTIESNMFEYCGNMNTVYIPESVELINGRAFEYCGNLKSILYEGTAEQWNSINKEYVFGSTEYMSEGIRFHYNIQPESAQTHLKKDVEVSASCYVDGESHVSCSCGYSYDETSHYKEHFKGDYIETIAPTCIESGYDVYSCKYCDEMLQYNFTGSLGHDHEEFLRIEPTCTSYGYVYSRCRRCSEEIMTDYFYPLGHSFENDVCTSCGMNIKSICLGDVKTITVSEENGDEYFKFIPEESGTYYFYSDCRRLQCLGTLYDENFNYICSDDYHGDDSSNFKIEYNFEKGKTYYFEAKFSYKEDTGSYYLILSEEFNGPHSYVSETVEPTCTAKGYIRSVCTRCGKSVISDSTAPLGHDVSDGKCIRCGAEIGEACTVELDLNGGFCEATSISVRDGDVFGELPYVFNEEYYKLFACWVDDNGNIIKSDTVFHSGDTQKLRAEWMYVGDGYIYGEALLRMEPDDLIAAMDMYYLYFAGETADFSVYTSTGKIGTSSYVMLEEERVYTVIFGDVNGDGRYDGTDSVIVNCIANGLLTKEQVGELVYIAADCNHDGVIDSADVALLEQAGVILASVDQNISPEELMTDSAYVEYLNLIDQNPTEEAPAEETPTNEPVDEGFNKSFIERIIDFIIYIVNLMKTFIAKF